MKIQNKTQCAMFIFLIALIVRLVFFGYFLANNPCALAGDSWLYHNLGKNMAHGLGYVGLDGGPNFYRVPGYPFFLALCYKICHDKIFWAMVIQVFFGALVPVFIYGLSLILFPTQYFMALLAGLIACFHVGLIVFSGLVLSDLMFLFFMLIFFMLFSLALKHNRLFLFFAAGGGLGLASLVRPMGFDMLLVITALLFIARGSMQIWAKRCCFLWGGWMGIVGLWLLRNFLLTGCLFFHTLAGAHFLNFFITPVTAIQSQISYDRAKIIVYKEYKSLVENAEQHAGRKILEIEKAQLVEKMAFKTGLSYPLSSLKYITKNMFKTCFSLYSAELLLIDSGGIYPCFNEHRTFKDMVLRFFNPNLHNANISYIIWWEVLFNLIILIGFFGFIVHSFCLRQNIFLLISFLLFSLFFVGVSFGCGYARFRLPIEPFLIIFACVFWTDFFKRGECCE